MYLHHDMFHPRSILTLRLRLALPLLIAALMTGCSTLPNTSSSARNPAPVSTLPPATSPRTPGVPPPALPAAGSGRGGYYQDDGPGDKTPEGLLDIPDVEPKIEPLYSKGNKPYVVFGKTYTPITDDRPFKQRGVGSWYGKKFHGQKTSSGELYDMYKMTAAHPTLPLPSYVRVTNVSNGKTVIVRVNDRGPFHSSRIIDLSYTAAYKLGYLGKGSSELEIERILPDEIEAMAKRKSNVASVSVVEPVAVVRPVVPVVAASATTIATAASVIRTPDEPARPEVYAVALPQAVASVPEPSIAPAPAMVPVAMPATASTASAMVPAMAPAAAPLTGFYLQFGAFSQAANAEAAGERLRGKWPAAIPPLTVVESNAFHRLYSGPFATREEAAAAAQSAQDAGLPKPMVVQRKD